MINPPTNFRCRPLRHPKETDGVRVRASTMDEVRATLAFVADAGIDLWASDANASRLRVDRTGKIWVQLESGEFVDHEQVSTLELEADYLELLAPFSTGGQRGPDLLQPRPRLRIVPLKVAGEPHVQGSRITTQTIAASRHCGFDEDTIAGMYSIERASVEQAVDLENQLSSSVGVAA